MYVSRQTMSRALHALKGTAGPLFKIWMTLKHMGLAEGHPVEVTTQNSTPNLERLFGVDGGQEFLIPFSHTDRFKTMKLDAARSIIQTNVRQWYDSTGTKDPTHLLDVRAGANDVLRVGLQRSYPVGLGTDQNGFSDRDGSRVIVPHTAFACWYGRGADVPDGHSPIAFLRQLVDTELNLTTAEIANVFDDDHLEIELAQEPLTGAELLELFNEAWEGHLTARTIPDSIGMNRERVAVRQSFSSRPRWMTRAPKDQLGDLLHGGATALLLTGPPRTGKSRALKELIVGKTAVEIQIHDGWTYANLVLGQSIDNGNLVWKPGPLLEALRGEVQFIVLEEANRTRLAEALGEIFSLLEPAYRGEANGIALANGERIHIRADTVFMFTSNTLDKSTHDLDDALFGRVRSVEFPPRVEDLGAILDTKGFTADDSEALRRFFQSVQEFYPLGHGYFASVEPDSDLALFYMSAIRPVLANHFAAFEPETLDQVDSLFDELVVRLDD